MTDDVPATGSKCPARIWPFRKHKFVGQFDTKYLQKFDNCVYCGARIP